MSSGQAQPSPSDAVAEVKRFGSTVLRNAWDPRHLNTIREAIVGFNALRAERIARGDETPLDRTLHPYGAGTFGQLLGSGVISPWILPEMLAESKYRTLCEEYFEDEILYATPWRLVFRNHEPIKSDQTFVPFHQDSGSQERTVRGVLNCWIPLDPGAGRDAPGLEVVRNPGTPNFPLKKAEPKSEPSIYDSLAIDQDDVLRQFGDQLLAPEFDLGDGFAFSQDVIHRTHVTPRMTKPRMNFEFRVFSLKHLVPGAIPEEVRRTSFRVAG